MVLSLILGIVGIICLIYYSVIVIYGGIHISMSFVWLAASVVFIFAAVLIRFLHNHNIQVNIIIKNIIRIFFASILLLFIVVEGMVIAGANTKETKNLDVIIVLGAKVNQNVPSNSLKKRIDKAYEYLSENENTYAIVSGAKGVGEDISEAECMKNYLVKMGIDESRIIIEDKSYNTDQNIENSMKICEERWGNAPTVGIVTNSYHIFRAVAVCKHKGFEVCGIPAKSNKILLANYMVREFFAIVKYRICGDIG